MLDLTISGVGTVEVLAYRKTASDEALACVRWHATTAQPFVTWRVYRQDDGWHATSGHYFDDEHAALRDFEDRFAGVTR